MTSTSAHDYKDAKITKLQIKIIHTLKSKLTLSDEEYRSWVMAHSDGFESSSLEMSYSQARALITDMKTEAVKRGVWADQAAARQRKYDNLGNRPGMATPRQLRMIEFMWAGVSYTHDQGKRASALRKFIMKICGKSAMEFVESRDVAKLVNAMQSMKKERRANET